MVFDIFYVPDFFIDGLGGVTDTLKDEFTRVPQAGMGRG